MACRDCDDSDTGIDDGDVADGSGDGSECSENDVDQQLLNLSLT